MSIPHDGSVTAVTEPSYTRDIFEPIQLGDRARAYSVTYPGRGRKYTVIVLYFRRGVLAEVLTTQGFAGTFTLAQVVALGRIIDMRFRRQQATGPSSVDAPLIHAALARGAGTRSSSQCRRRSRGSLECRPCGASSSARGGSKLQHAGYCWPDVRKRTGWV